jgi:glucose-1-phosphate cytidylyltransferase
LLKTHVDCKRLATVTAVHPSSRYGEIDIEEGSVSDFMEKPQVNNGWINGGYFVFEKKAFDDVSTEPGVVLENDVLPKIVRQKQLTAYHHDGFWQCMDTYREMLMLNGLISQGKAPWLS